jgi:site-specific DNA recombinase
MASKQTNTIRCAVYTRKSTEHGLELEFNSLDAQREACEAYIKSQAAEGWRALPDRYDDPAISGGTLERPVFRRGRQRRRLSSRQPYYRGLPEQFRQA